MELIDMTEVQKNAPFIVKVAKLAVPMMLIVAGGVAWAYFKATAPTIERVPPERSATAVQVMPVTESDARTVVTAMGTVVPSREVTLKSRVSGEIRSVASQFVPGGRIAKGEVLLSLDLSDLEIEVSKAESALEDARAALAIEQGSQTIAREEIRMLSEMSAEGVAKTDLSLRKPQLQQARAAVSSAEADSRKARLDLERAVVRAPFNALIIDRSVNMGTYVGARDTLATLVGTDEFWVEAVVPLDQLSLIDIHHEGGCPVRIRSQSGSGGVWQGQVVRIAGKVNETSRMATVIVAVSDPLEPVPGHSTARLMIDDYVFVDITGRTLSHVIELPRSVLQDGNTVWVCNNNSLDIRSVTLAWKNTDKVFIRSGLKGGEHVVVSELSSPVKGMALKILDSKSDAVTKGDERAETGKRAEQ
jgi:RND family efflux transporter MFP subunit